MTSEGRQLVYTIQETCQKLGISRNLGYRLAREGKLPGVIPLGGKRMVVSRAVIDSLLAGGQHQEPRE